MQKTTVYLDDSEAAGLRRLSEATGKSQAALVREALRQLLGQAPPRRFHSMGQGKGVGAPAGAWDPDALYRHVMGQD